jgi:hypothetical protein
VGLGPNGVSFRSPLAVELETDTSLHVPRIAAFILNFHFIYRPRLTVIVEALNVILAALLQFCF